MATLKAKAAKIYIELERGATFDETFVWKDSAKAPIDLTGYSARMQVRTELGAEVFTDELTTANGRIVLNAPTGGIRLIISAADSTSLYLEDSYVYDFELVEPSTKVRRLFEGSITVLGEVTR